MAISAKFIADFTQWDSAVQGATAKLKLVTAQTDAVAAGMTKAGQAAASSVPSLTGATGAATSLTGAFHQFDGVLASLGVHIGPEIKGLEDLAGASGKSAGEIGKLGTAGLIAGAALAGWKLGRLVADFFDLDNAIGNATAKMLGWGDLVGETAGAKQDVITRAVERGAKATITYGEALQFNNKWFTEHNKTVAAGVKAQDEWADAMVELNAAGEGWQGTLDSIDGETVNAIQYYLDAGVSQNKLATAYHLTDVQVKAIASSMTAAAAAAAAEQKDVDLLIGAYEKLHQLTIDNDRKIQADLLVMQGAQLQIVNAAIVAEFDAQTKLNAAMGRDAAGALQVQTTAAETLRVGLEKLHAAKVEGISQVAQETVLADAFSQSLYDEAVAQDKLYASLGKVNAETAKVPAVSAQAVQSITAIGTAISFTLEQAHQWNALMAEGSNVGNAASTSPFFAGTVANDATTSKWVADTLRGMPGRASGGSVSGGSSYMVGERGPELFTPGSSGVISPNGGAPIINNFYLVDNSENLARKVSDLITKNLRRSGPV